MKVLYTAEVTAVRNPRWPRYQLQQPASPHMVESDPALPSVRVPNPGM